VCSKLVAPFSTISMLFFWTVMPCGFIRGYQCFSPEDEDSMFRQNVDIYVSTQHHNPEQQHRH
jgi:hypothetical protein